MNKLRSDLWSGVTLMDESIIPHGMYCYSYTDEKSKSPTGIPNIKMCPYWGKDNTKPPQANGFCTFLNRRDWDDTVGIPLLWDAIKECNINKGKEDEY